MKMRNKRDAVNNQQCDENKAQKVMHVEHQLFKFSNDSF